MIGGAGAAGATPLLRAGARGEVGPPGGARALSQEPAGQGIRWLSREEAGVFRGVPDPSFSSLRSQRAYWKEQRI